MSRYFAVHKPYHMLSQFRGGAPGLRMLGDLDYSFPEGIHAVGRLDYQSEGLLLLTTDSRVTRLLFDSEVPHRRTYLVQVYKQVAPETLEQWRQGIPIRVKGGDYYTTAPCGVSIVDRPAALPPGPDELRPDIPQTWLEITLTEGRFRQVRKMCTAARHPCMRLIRTSIEALELGTLPAGGVRELEGGECFRLLRILGA